MSYIWGMPQQSPGSEPVPQVSPDRQAARTPAHMDPSTEASGAATPRPATQPATPPTPATSPATSPVTSPGKLTRGQSIVQLLRQRLQDGTWPVGTRLPGEHELAAELGVGRNTLREALRSLVSAGFLKARRGDGTYVIATDDLEVALSRRVTPEERLHALEVRTALEIESARLAATRATPEELDRLRELTEERRAASHGSSDVAFLRLDLAWHDAVAQAARNPILQEIYLGLDRVTSYFSHTGEAEVHAAALSPSLNETGGPHVHGRIARLDQAHDQLLAALCDRDADAAVAAARRIFDASEQLRTLPGDPA
ncbi:FCD domain-containing protein [Galactobacter caseinivorans]|uniref:FCD domain-containing protein n=2 Tax=Galactobacter caseinivorans TaxID=2676123 RepID=A0A496PHX2_9MICC|nr:FCD domain-containing protein [Galactobacter caseinivorans]